jgi:putative tricarboxylic transport membrane protein
VRVNDAVWGALFLALSGAILIHVQGFPRIPGQNVGPGLFPGAIATGIAVCGLILVVRGLAARRAPESITLPGAAWLSLPGWVRSREHVIAFLVLVGVNVFYLAAVDKLGFLITGWVYLFALMRVLKVRTVVAGIVSLLMTLAIHYAFYKLLRVPLPWGVLTPLAW